MKTTKPATTIIEKWQLIIWGLSFLLILTLLFLFIASPLTRFFFGFICLVASYYLSRYLCKADTFFEHNDNILIISRYCKTLNINDSFQINISEIRGFEINEVTRANRALLLYFTNFKYLKLSLTKISDERIIENFLVKVLTRINENSNPLFKSFGAAYWFALKKCLLFLALSMSFLGILIWQHTALGLSIFQAGILITILSIGLWMLIVNKPIKCSYFRFGASYWFSNFLIYLSPLLLFPVYFLSVQREQKPLNLQNPFQVFEKSPTTLYKFNNVNYNPNGVIVANYFFSTNSGRSLKQPVYHYFATPITEIQPILTNGTYQIWLAKYFIQSIYKRDDKEVKTKRALDYQSTAKQNFISLFAHKPVFYKALFNDNKAYQTVRKTHLQQNILLY